MFLVSLISRLPKLNFSEEKNSALFTKDDLEALVRGILVKIRDEKDGEKSYKALAQEVLTIPLLRTNFKVENSKDKTSFLYKFIRSSEDQNTRYDGNSLVSPFYGEIDFSAQFLVELIELIHIYLSSGNNASHELEGNGTSKKITRIELNEHHEIFLKNIKICIDIDNYFISNGITDNSDFENLTNKSIWIRNLLELFKSHFNEAISFFLKEKKITLKFLKSNSNKNSTMEFEATTTELRNKHRSQVTKPLVDLTLSYVKKSLENTNISDNDDLILLISEIRNDIDEIHQIEDNYNNAIDNIYLKLFEMLEDLKEQRSESLIRIRKVLNKNKRFYNPNESEINISSIISHESKDIESIPDSHEILPLPNQEIMKLLRDQFKTTNCKIEKSFSVSKPPFNFNEIQ